MIYLNLFIEFFKIGLFAVGGGLATIPFLYNLANKYGWFTAVDITNMLAISESTPGPIGVNMSTYAGFNAAGILGGIVATFSIVLPPLIIAVIVYRLLDKFKDNFYVNSAFYGMKPAVLALIIIALLEIFKVTFAGVQTFINIKAVISFLLILFLVLKFKKIHPIIFIIIGALLGIIFKI